MKYSAGMVVTQLGLSAIAAEREKVNVAALLKAFQSPRHGEMLGRLA
jgi:hypothetical protein